MRQWSFAVPTVYPRDMYTQLRMVDTLEKMGISSSFSGEIYSILDMIYRYKLVMMKPAEFLLLLLNISWLQSFCSSWLANDEEIMLDMTTCAMAFRLLRFHGYDIPSGMHRRT